jgi:hypothetical protein
MGMRRSHAIHVRIKQKRIMMWLLFILVATFTNVNVSHIDTYQTLDDCNGHKLQFEREFQQQYPADKDYAFVCVFVKTN